VSERSELFRHDTTTIKQNVDRQGHVNVKKYHDEILSRRSQRAEGESVKLSHGEEGSEKGAFHEEDE
jgi:hypothetical protein